MSSITSILKDKETSAADKLSAVSEIVAAARKKYGNSSAKISSTSVNTVNGAVDFEFLEDDSKVSILLGEATRIKLAAIEASKTTEGVVINKEIERSLATSPVFANIESGVSFDYV